MSNMPTPTYAPASMLDTKNPAGCCRIEASFFSAAFEKRSIVSVYMRVLPVLGPTHRLQATCQCTACIYVFDLATALPCGRKAIPSSDALLQCNRTGVVPIVEHDDVHVAAA